MSHYDKEKSRILIVEDEKEIRDILEILLKSEGYQVLCSSNGEEGLQAFNEFSPEVVLLDIKMPVMDGFGFLRSVKPAPGEKYEVIVVSAHLDNSDVTECYDLGAAHILHKPFYSAEVKKLVARSVERLHMTREKIDSQAKLEENSNIFNALLNTSTHLSFLIRPNGEILDLNEKSTDFFNTSKEEVIGKNIFGLVSEQAAADARELIKEVLKTGKPIVHQHHERQIDFESNIFPVKDEHGNVKYIFVFSYDISEQKNLERSLKLAVDTLSSEIREKKKVEGALKESEERLRYLAKATSAAVMIHDKGIVLEANEEYIRMFGFSAEEMINQNCLEKTIAPESQLYVRNKIANSVTESYEVSALRKDGSRFPIEIFPVNMEYNGKPVRGVVVIDITERKKAQKAIAEAAEKWEETFNAIVDMLIITDENFNIIRANRAAKEFLGNNTKILNEKCYNIIHKTEAPPDSCPCVKGMINGKEKIEIHLKNRTFEVRLYPVLSEDKKIGALIHILRDITEQKKTQEQLHIYQVHLEELILQRTRKLQESEEFSRSLLKESPNPILVFNVDKSIHYVNPAFEKLSGFSSTSILNTKPPYPWWPADRIDEYSGVLNDAFGEGLRKRDLQFVRKTGENFIVEISMAKVYHEDKVKYLLSSWTDVTEHRKADKALKQYTDRLRMHIHETPMGYIEWDKDLNVIDWNPAAEKIFGYRKEEAIGIYAFDIVPEDSQKIVRQKIKSLESDTEAFFLENENITGDGRRITCKWYNTPLLDNMGKVHGLASLVEDVTVQRKLEKELQMLNESLENKIEERVRELAEEMDKRKEAQENLRAVHESLKSQFEFQQMLIDTIPVPVFYTDRHGILAGCNQTLAEFFRRSRSDINGKSISDLIPENTDTVFRATRIEDIEKELSRPGMAKSETVLLDSKGNEHSIIMCRAVYYSSENTPLGLIAAFVDITEQKKMEKESEQRLQQLMHSDKLASIGRLVAGVAHEINNPTNFITLNIPIIKEAWENIMPFLEEKYHRDGDFNIGRFKYTILKKHIDKLLSGIKNGADRIRTIVSDLKNYSRPEDGKIEENVDVNKIIESAVNLLSTSINKSTAKFEFKPGSGIPPIRASSSKLEQVIVNLINNACEALTSHEQGIKIKTSYQKSRNKVIIKVFDEGRGIPEDIIKSITDPFFTTKRDTGGTGLGLSVSSQIIESCGGKMLFDSKPGKGTGVTLKLPAKYR